MMESKGPAMAIGKKDGAMMRSKDSAAMTEKRDGTMMESKDGMMTKLPDQQFAAHFVGSNPRHGTALAQAPAQLVLNFNFTLSEASSIMVTRDGVAVSASKPTFSNNKLTMSTTLPASAGKGLYQVDYKACWPDNSCHSGRFAYTVGS